MPEDMQISVTIAFEQRQCILSAATKDAYVCILRSNVLSCIAPAAVGLNGVRAMEICNDPNDCCRRPSCPC